MKIILIAFISILCCVTSCIENQPANNVNENPSAPGDISKVTNGMIADSVIQICGTPVVIHTLAMADSGKNKVEVWEYSGNKLLMFLNDTLIDIRENEKAGISTLANSTDSVLTSRHLVIGNDSVRK